MTPISNPYTTLFHLITALRLFFAKEKFLDVITPPVVPNPGMEAHIHPFQIYSIVGEKLESFYLHTSPEFHMKRLLSLGLEKIFTIGYCFRDEPKSPIHRKQFLMLEWYRAHQRYERIMDDCEALVTFCAQYLKDAGIPLALDPLSSSDARPERATVQDLVKEYTGVDILNFLDQTDLKELLEKDFPDIPLPSSNASGLHWDDYFFLLFLNRVEPKLKERRFLIVYEFPYHLCALSTIKEGNPKVCERFEIYLDGIELGNCFNELTDLAIQQQRFKEQNAIKRQLYRYELPAPQMLYQALETGLPASAGIAVGVERLLLGLTGMGNPFFSDI